MLGFNSIRLASFHGSTGETESEWSGTSDIRVSLHLSISMNTAGISQGEFLTEERCSVDEAPFSDRGFPEGLGFV